MWTVARLRADLAAGRTSSRELTEQALARIADPHGEGARSFIRVYAQTARAEADFADRLRLAGVVRSPVDGLPVSVKDLFDVAGDVTRAGSTILAGSPPARADAAALARLRAAGAVLVGRTNMVEFAVGGVGLNPHYGTPRNPWDRAMHRAPGGSSSGAAVAVADGQCVMGLGSDTRGSVRIPSAMCGTTGFKPTARRVPTAGAFPLSYAFDSVGPLANSVQCCAAYDAVLAGEPQAALPALSSRGLRIMLPRCSLLEGLDAAVAAAFEASLQRLSAAGALVIERPMPAFDRQDAYFRGGGIPVAEVYAVHRAHRDRFGEMDPRVAQRIALGEKIAAADYVDMAQLRASCAREVAAAAAGFDAILMPTAPCTAPTIAEADASDEAYTKWNLRMFRNCGLINFLDGCAVTLPCHEPGSAPVGLSVCGVAMTDRHVLAVSAAVQDCIAH